MPLMTSRSIRKWSISVCVVIAALIMLTPLRTMTTRLPRSVPVVKRLPLIVQVRAPRVSRTRIAASSPNAETMPMRGVHSLRQARGCGGGEARAEQQATRARATRRTWAHRSSNGLRVQAKFMPAARRARPARPAAAPSRCARERARSPSSRRAFSAATIAGSPLAASALPSATAQLRCQRSKPMRRIALPSVSRRKSSSRQAQSASSCGESSAGLTSKSASRARARELVPRADELAVVAAVDAVADGGAELDRDRALRFDRQVRDAAARVELVGRDDRLRRADVDARAAAAAVVGRDRALGQGDVDEDLAEEEHRAGVAIEGERVLAAPADAAPRRELDLEHRRRIGEDAMAERADRRGERVGEQAQALAQDLVIVAAAGVDRYRRRAGVGEAAPFDRLPAGLGPRRQVVEPGGDDAERSGDELGGAGALHSVRGHVVHLAVKAVVEPGGQPRLGRPQVDPATPIWENPSSRPQPRSCASTAGPSTERGSLIGGLTDSRNAPRFVARRGRLRRLAPNAREHDALHDAFIELHGPLGAGKTTFVRHLLHGLGVQGSIKSPTYALLEPYRASPPAGGFDIAHFDFCRFDDPAEWEDAGLSRGVRRPGGSKLVEWPEKASGLLPECDSASGSLRATAATPARRASTP
jgi:tRNA threonylcarbamoyl adenosine modification protein YjeE